MLTMKGAACGLAGMALLLAGCGGGGGSGGNAVSMSVSPGSVTLNADTRDNAPRASLVARLSGDLDRDVQPYIEHTANAITGVGFIENTDDQSGTVHINFAVPETLGPGTYRDTVTLKLCYDPACTEQVIGSPRQISVNLTVTGGVASPAEPALAPASSLPDSGTLAIESSVLLDHDVLDAEYSKALDAIVMVSGSPSPKLHVYYPATGVKRSVTVDDLRTSNRSNRLPSVSVSPDGLSANVAFGEQLSHVNLNRGGDPFLPGGSSVNMIDRPAMSSPSDAPSALWFISANDLVSIGSEIAFVFPHAMPNILKINARSGESSRVGDDSDLLARLHPEGNAIYTSNVNRGASTLSRYSTEVRPDFQPVRNRTLPSEEKTCDNLWLSANGRRIYTACGKIFRTSAYPSQDMSALGALAVYNTPVYPGVSTLVDLQDSAEAGQIAALQGPSRNGSFIATCQVHLSCRTRLHLYDSTTTQATASYAIPASTSGQQVAWHVFYSKDGTRKYLITWSPGDSSYRILTVQ